MSDVKHIIVLMLENRSFDHLLGRVNHPNSLFEQLNLDDPIHENPLDDGSVSTIWSSDAPYFVSPDPGHKHADVMAQMFSNFDKGNPPRAGTPPDMRGFAKVHARKEGAKAADAMRCYADGQAPVLQTLAKRFRTCTRWFSSVPGATWPNRLFAMCGQSAGLVDNDKSDTWFFESDSVFSAVEPHGDWRVYHDGPCLPNVIKHTLSKNSRGKYHSLGRLLKDIGDGDLPAFSWVEPDHFGLDSSSQHAGFINKEADTWGFLSADNLIGKIYNKLLDNETLFNETVFIITYDEHGGFYDHVAPPNDAQPPSAEHIHYDEESSYQFDFRQLGPRVPAVIVSPLIEPKSVDTTHYDHTAIIRAAANAFVPNGAGLISDRVSWSKDPLVSCVGIKYPVGEMEKIDLSPLPDKPSDAWLAANEAADDLLSTVLRLAAKLPRFVRGFDSKLFDNSSALVIPDDDTDAFEPDQQGEAALEFQMGLNVLTIRDFLGDGTEPYTALTDSDGPAPPATKKILDKKVVQAAHEISNALFGDDRD